eukprot:UN09511
MKTMLQLVAFGNLCLFHRGSIFSNATRMRGFGSKMCLFSWTPVLFIYVSHKLYEDVLQKACGFAQRSVIDWLSA